LAAARRVLVTSRFGNLGDRHAAVHRAVEHAVRRQHLTEMLHVTLPWLAGVLGPGLILQHPQVRTLDDLEGLGL
jgi:hypothetical protein